ncbi:hypothetical protein B6U83_00550 [Thermoplasmatales archaeon ex4484_36]|nr:MAG: hypothetical protein B6U83_00550 [Thermoplasmatales archaeon ex4484_36]RLF68087.1 MAG: hypothetical protein DRN40_07940 [Thermoplasmata archaeon]RLF71198.1 MAG: hypothetical protein DRN55_07640 [Thermoplasmata archaeon]RLF76723.1 MAG: hypothetical protein DRN42_00445 [Thermoplasmata archaeon]HDD59356.1 acyl-CoA thioesterase [Euryarchaeota archaeon]
MSGNPPPLFSFSPEDTFPFRRKIIKSPCNKPLGGRTQEKDGYLITAARRVRVYDTDFAGVVYYGSYTRWIEEAVAEYMRGHSLPFSELQRREVYFAVKEVRIEYLSPVRYEEVVELGVRPPELKGRRVTFQFCFFRGADPVVRGEITYASIDKDFRPREIPEWVKEEYMKMRR